MQECCELWFSSRPTCRPWGQAIPDPLPAGYTLGSVQPCIRSQPLFQPPALKQPSHSRTPAQMAPKAEKKPAKKVAVKKAGGAAGGKAKRSASKSETYKVGASGPGH